MSQIQIILQHLTKYSSFTSLDLSLHLYTHCVYTVTLNFHLFCVLFLFCSQKGTHFGYILPLVNRLKNEEIEEQYEAVLKISVEALRNKTRNAENNEDLCSNDAPKPDIPTGKLSACCIALAIFCCVLSCLCVGWIVKCFIIKKSRACSQEGV